MLFFEDDFESGGNRRLDNEYPIYYTADTVLLF